MFVTVLMCQVNYLISYNETNTNTGGILQENKQSVTSPVNMKACSDFNVSPADIHDGPTLLLSSPQ